MAMDRAQNKNSRMKDGGRADLSAILEKIEWAHRNGRPLNLRSFTPAKWVTAAEHLFRLGRVEAAYKVAQQILTSYPDLRWAKIACRFCAHVPPEHRHLPFSDDSSKDVQVVRRPGSDTVILLFCDVRHHLNVPLPIMHRWFGQLPASLIYLRDFRLLFFLSGIASLAPSRTGTLAALQEIISSLGARRILCFGNSGGGFPALHYGLDLAARGVISMSGFVRLSHLPDSSIVHKVAADYPETFDLDMRTAYGEAKSPPNVRLVYGAQSASDREQAEHMRSLPTVKLQPLTGFGGHNALMESVSRGIFPSMLDWLLDQR
jgi:hypothetical protein